MNTKTIVNVAVFVVVAGILFYLGETETTLVLIALAGIAYLIFRDAFWKLTTA